MAETRREKIIKYLRIFQERKLPRLDNRLLKFIETNDEELQLAAIAANCNNQDNSLRDLVIKLLKQQSHLNYNRILKLLINNYQLGDFKFIEPILNLSQDLDYRHDLGMDLLKIIDT